LFAGCGVLVGDRCRGRLCLIGERRNIISGIMIIRGIGRIGLTLTDFTFNY